MTVLHAALASFPQERLHVQSAPLVRSHKLLAPLSVPTVQRALSVLLARKNAVNALILKHLLQAPLPLMTVYSLVSVKVS